jgi:urocanate reductase
VRIFVDSALDGYEWLKGLGVTWDKMGVYEAPAYLPSDPSVASLQGSSRYLQVYDEDGCYKGVNHKGRWIRGAAYKDEKKGAAIMAALEDCVADTCPNVEVVTGVAMKSIVREGIVTGDVTGIVVDEGGVEKRVRAKRAVILTCGGYAANPDLVHLSNMKVDLSVKPSGGTGNTGDGLIAAGFIGAQTVNMSSVQITHGCNANSNNLSTATSMPANPFNGPATFINLDASGKRFWGEMEGSAQYADAKLTVLSSRHMVNYWTVGDAASVAAAGATDDDLAKFTDGLGHVCNSVEELAGVIGCDAATLQETLDTYNGFVDAGIDTDFGKATHYLTQHIEQPPFYAFETCYCCRSTPGGLRVNADASVLDLNGEPIPRLYAAGEVTGSVHGYYRNTGGDSWTECVCFGRIAGANAASEQPFA